MFVLLLRYGFEDILPAVDLYLDRGDTCCDDDGREENDKRKYYKRFKSIHLCAKNQSNCDDGGRHIMVRYSKIFISNRLVSCWHQGFLANSRGAAGSYICFGKALRSALLVGCLHIATSL